MPKVAVAAVALTAVALLILGALLLGTGERPAVPRTAKGQGNEEGQASETRVPPSEAGPREPPDAGSPFEAPVREAVTGPLATVTVSGTVQDVWERSEDNRPVPEVLVRLLRRRIELSNLPLPLPPTDGDRASTDRWMRQALDFFRGGGPAAPEEELSRVVTDAAGAFSLQVRLSTSRIPAALVLRAEKSGWLDGEGGGVLLQVTSLPFERTGLVYRMGRALPVSGKVIDAVAGTPIRGARIHPESGRDRMGGALPSPALPAATTDQDGGFQLDLGFSPAAMLVVEAEGFLPGLARVYRTHGPRELQVRLLPVSAAAVIRGTVFEAGGSPAEDAEVKLSAQWMTAPPSRVDDSASREYFELLVTKPGVRSAPDGTFTILLPYGGSWTLTAEREGQEGRATVSVAPGERATCRIELESFRVAGWIVDEVSGEPIPGARVRGESAAASNGGTAAPPPRPPDPSATTDEGGRFLIDLGGRRNATLLVEADGYLQGSADVSRTPATTEIRVPLVRASGAPRLRGIVLDTSGIPVARAQLQIERVSGANPGERSGPRSGSLDHFVRRVLGPGLMTSADGTFEVQLPYAGWWKVTARRGPLENSVSLALGAGEEAFCRIELELLSCRISGWVVDENGAPVAATVYVRWEGGFLGSTAREGRFDLRVSPRHGPCRVQAEHGGRRSAEISVALGNPAEEHDLGALVLPPK